MRPQYIKHLRSGLGSRLRSPSAFINRFFRPRSSRPSFRFIKNFYTDYRALKTRGPWSLRFSRMSDPNSYASSSGTPPSLSPSPSSIPATPTSRRQRLLGFARATRDTYIPKITTSVSLFASGIGSRAIEYDEYGMVASLPSNTQFTLYPSYTRKIDGKYIVTVRGWMWCPGNMSRKNRLVLSLAKQVTRSNDDTAQVAVDRLEHDPTLSQNIATEDESDSASISTSASNGSGATSASSQLRDSDARLRSRLSSFLARSIPNAGLAIVVGAADSLKATELRLVSVVTDPNGHFKAEIDVSYAPSVVQVVSKIDEAVCAFQEIHHVEYNGYGVISDIDDTVKLTGVIGDKRELMRRLLLGEIESWEIKAVVSWFNNIHARFNATFFYVSNSPWQFFNVIQEYVPQVQLPPGSFHLKQYTGNIISSLMEPSSSRKKTSLSKILNDFPEKLFICVGDSGEHDFEAYVDLAVSYPSQVRGIYIRAVEDSLSDVDDSNILKEMKRLLREWKRKQSPKVTEKKPKAPLDDLIDLSDGSSSASNATEKTVTPVKKPPPAIPKKPLALKGSTVNKVPPLPERRYLQGSLTDTKVLHEHIAEQRGETPPPLPRRTTSPATFEDHADNLDHQINLLRIHDISSYYELEDYDKKGAIWLQRLTKALELLDGAGVDIAFFEDHEKTFFAETMTYLDRQRH